MRWMLPAALALLALAGCSGGHDPNYSTKVELTEEQKAAAKANMAGQKAPGALDPGTGQPQQLGVPGKKSR